jgi:hypothetical protein
MQVHGQFSIIGQLETIFLIFAVGLEETTFNIMWDMSKAGSDAEECFLRQVQTQYYGDATTDVHVFEKMPNVSSSYVRDSYQSY